MEHGQHSQNGVRGVETEEVIVKDKLPHIGQHVIVSESDAFGQTGRAGRERQQPRVLFRVNF